MAPHNRTFWASLGRSLGAIDQGGVHLLSICLVSSLSWPLSLTNRETEVWLTSGHFLHILALPWCLKNLYTSHFVFLLGSFGVASGSERSWANGMTLWPEEPEGHTISLPNWTSKGKVPLSRVSPPY